MRVRRPERRAPACGSACSSTGRPCALQPVGASVLTRAPAAAAPARLPQQGSTSIGPPCTSPPQSPVLPVPPRQIITTAPSPSPQPDPSHPPPSSPTRALDQAAAQRDTAALSQQGSLDADTSPSTRTCRVQAHAAAPPDHRQREHRHRLGRLQGRRDALETTVYQLANYKLFSVGRPSRPHRCHPGGRAADASAIAAADAAAAAAAEAARVANTPDGARARPATHRSQLRDGATTSSAASTACGPRSPAGDVERQQQRLRCDRHPPGPARLEDGHGRRPTGPTSAAPRSSGASATSRAATGRRARPGVTASRSTGTEPFDAVRSGDTRLAGRDRSGRELGSVLCASA